MSWQALEVFNFMMSLRILSLCIFEKEKGSLRFLLQTSSIASMLGWFLYFTIYFKTELWYCWLKGHSSNILRWLKLLIILEKKVFKTSAVLPSSIIISSFSVNVIFWVDVTLSNKKVLMVFQKVNVKHYTMSGKNMSSADLN